MSAPLQGTESAANSIARVKYTHDAMIDLIIANPAISQNDLAKAFGYSVPWVSRVLNSDAFQARLAERKEDIVDPTITATLEEKFKAVASKSLDVVLEKLSQPLVPADFALKALDSTARALNYGARGQNVNVQQNFVVALPMKAPSEQAWAATYGSGAPTIVEQR